MLPISREVISSELKSVIEILTKWEKQISEGGIPMMDTPGDEEALDLFLRQLSGEVMLCSGKCGILAEGLTGQ